MNKKLLATILASTMVLGSMSVYAAAGDVDEAATAATAVKLPALSDAGQKITVKTTAAPLKIDVTLPTSMNMVLNPYKIEDKAQILSPVIPIISDNTTNVTLGVKVTAFDVTIAGAGTVKPTLLAAKPADNAAASTKKDIFLYLRSADAAISATDAADVTNLKFAVDPTFESASDKSRIITKTGPLATPIDLGVLKKDTAIGWKFDGMMNDKVLWDSKDLVTAIPTFSFIPVVTTP